MGAKLVQDPHITNVVIGYDERWYNFGILFKNRRMQKLDELRHKIEQINSFFRYLENNIFSKSRFRFYLVEILRAIFDYPKVTNENYESLSRLKLKIFLRFFKINLYPNIKSNINESKIISIKNF